MTSATERRAEPLAAAPQFTIHVNAEALQVRAGTLADVLAQLGYGGQKVATAVNGDFVPERARAAMTGSAGDRIEILSARQGG